MSITPIAIVAAIALLAGPRGATNRMCSPLMPDPVAIPPSAVTLSVVPASSNDCVLPDEPAVRGEISRDSVPDAGALVSPIPNSGSKNRTRVECRLSAGG